MKEIPLTQGKVALVDDEDYEGLMQWKWYYHKTGYAVRTKTMSVGKRRLIHMHRVILNPPLGYEADHVNRNGLDNRRKNLRLATRAQNNQNVGVRLDNTSGFKGISWYKAGNKWRAYIGVNRKIIHLGYFKDKIEAAIVYNEAATKLHGEFAHLNQMGA